MLFVFILFFSVNWVIINEITYKSPCVLVIGSDEYPLFGKIHTVLTVRNKVLFNVQVLKCLEFCSHHHCYIVELTSEERYVSASDLLSYLPLHMHVFPAESHVHVCAIVPKHRLLTID